MVAVGGVLSGVPVTSMMAVAAIAEGAVRGASIVVWLTLLARGVVIDLILVPSMLLGSVISAIAAPRATRGAAGAPVASPGPGLPLRAVGLLPVEGHSPGGGPAPSVNVGELEGGSHGHGEV